MYKTMYFITFYLNTNGKGNYPSLQFKNLQHNNNDRQIKTSVNMTVAALIL